MKGKNSIQCAIIMTVLFMCCKTALIAADKITVDDILTEENTNIRLMYPQVGFWGTEVLLEGSSRRMGASSNELKELMKKSPKGSAYLDDYRVKSLVGYIGIYGGLLAYIGVPVLVMSVNNSYMSYDYYSIGTILFLAGEVVGLIFMYMSLDDFHRAILEYNRTQVNKGCAAAGKSGILSYNLNF